MPTATFVEAQRLRLRRQRRILRAALWLLIGTLLLLAGTISLPAAEVNGIESLRAAIEDLLASFPADYPNGPQYLARLEQLGQRNAAGEDIAAQLDVLRREALLANPLVASRPIAFVVRRQYAPDHHNTGTLFQPGEINAGSYLGGGAIRTLDLSAGGRVTTLLESSEGVMRDLEVSYDGQRLLFAWRPEAITPYHIFEMRADGSGLSQLTSGDQASDIDPVYLPDSHIAFASTRDPKYCGCNRHIQSNLFVMDEDGANIHQIGRNNLFESRPSVMEDGRILYDRWEYVDRHFGPSFGLWTMYPDGTRQELFYGNNAWSPGAIFDARMIPGSRQVVAVFGACHDRPWGAMVILDRRRGLDGLPPIVKHWPPDLTSLLPDPVDVPRKAGIEHPHVGLIDSLVGLSTKYEDPWPLSDKYFLCSRMTGQGEQMGIYLLDLFGNEVLVHMEDTGCFDPMSVGPRPRPPTPPTQVDTSQELGTFYVADVYHGTGMGQVQRGTIQTIRVVEAPPKRHWTKSGQHWHVDTHQAPAMNFNCTNSKRILGDAPVEADGSAYFQVPADRFVYFQLLDSNGMMVQSMRSGVTVRPGERAGCFGCHEQRLSGIPSMPASTALRRGPVRLQPWYGPQRDFNYLSEVQPVFDKYCVSCHDYGQEAGNVLNLSGDLGLVFNTSYLDLRTKSPIRWHADLPGEPKSLIKAVDDGPPQVLPAFAWGSHRSRLVDVLLHEHYDVKLDRESIDRVITWIDLNAPYYGNYASAYPDNLFGRSPLNDQQLARLASLTGVPVNAPNVGAELGGSQVNFTRPEWSRCFARLVPGSPSAREALEIVQAGKESLEQMPRTDMPGFRLVSPQDCRRQERVETLAQSEQATRSALREGRKHFDQQAMRAAEKLISPVAIVLAAGAAFPQAADNSNPPDDQYAAERAIDGDANTFCCLLDDSLDGTLETTIPAQARGPVTGYILFDLGRPLPVRGARMIARNAGGSYNPRDVQFVSYPGVTPPGRASAGLADSAGPLPNSLCRHTFGPLRDGQSEDVFWEESVTRFVAIRVESSYESVGPVHYNFQIAEMQLFVNPAAEVPVEILVNRTARQSWQANVISLRAAIEDLQQKYPSQYPGPALLQRLEHFASQAGDFAGSSDARFRDQFQSLCRAALIDANPLMPDKLLFVKRYTYNPGWYYAEFMSASQFGGNLCVLDVKTRRVTELVPQLAGGIFDRCDLSFDAQRVLFAYKAAVGQGFRIWEVNSDGTGLRQLTFDPPDEQARIAKYWHPRNKPAGAYRHHTDDFHPCYLPDGGICFASTRCEQGVLCDQGDSLAVNVLYRMDASGGNMRRLSQGALSESTPSVANDGRILYTRWEYVDKGVIAVQALWAMRPDGSGSTEIYGDQIEFPPVLIHGRAIPGSHNLFAATATMHHPFAVGPIVLVDSRRDITTQEPLRSLTPDTSLDIDGVGGFPRGEKFVHFRHNKWVPDNCGPLFSEPFPLADPATDAGAGKYFLVDCNPDKPWNDLSAYGLYLIDVFGNRVKIYDDPQISCWQPMPLRPRQRPPVIAPTHSQSYLAPEEAVVVLSDVYRGLEGVAAGTIKYLRVLEQVPRPWSARRFWPQDEALGQHAIISLNAHIFVKIHHGVVPVDEDGSAHFIVPARKNLFFQVLDENFMEVQRMRSFVNLEPGEVRSCIGCHESRHAAQPSSMPLAVRHPPHRLTAQPGESVPRAMHYAADVQPVLDRHCVRCHNEKTPEGEVDLSGNLTTYFNRSYETIMNGKLVAYIQEFQGPQPRAQKTNVVTLPPYSLGSHASRLISLIREGHYDCQLSREELVQLTTWADTNAPYYGSYFGRRNLMYREHPDFRPVPQLEDQAAVHE